MSELVYALKARFDKIYEKYDNDEYDGNYNQSEVDDYYEIKKLIKKYINKTTINDTIINHIIFIDGYDYKYIYMVLLNYEYKFTNMIVLFSFFFNFSYFLVELNKVNLIEPVIETLFNSTITEYFGKEIIITDKDIDSILLENSKNIRVTEEIIDCDDIFNSIYIYYKLSYCFYEKINWLNIIKYIEYNIKNKKLNKYKKILQNYQNTNYNIQYPVFKLDFIKYKNDFDNFLANKKYIYDKSTNKLIDI